jgi:hypothetical protein
MIYFGSGTADEKVFCEEQNHDATDMTQMECNIFSIGSNDNWGFELEVLQKMPHCKTHTFDCTLPNNSPKKKPQSDKVSFYPYCIGSSHTQDHFLTYHQLVARTNITSPPKLLKMDVEGFEFDVLLSILSTNRGMWPEQIVMEVHWGTRMVDVPWMLRTRQGAEISLFFGTLFTHGG